MSNFKLLQSPVVQSPRDTFWVPWIQCVETNSVMGRREIEIYCQVAVGVCVRARLCVCVCRPGER